MEREALRKAKLANKLVKRGKKQTLQGEAHYMPFLGLIENQIFALPPNSGQIRIIFACDTSGNNLSNPHGPA